MKKILYIVNVGKRLNNFSYSSMLAAQQLGFEFHIAGNWTEYKSDHDKELDEKKYGVVIHQIDFIRKPYDIRNIKAYKQICKLIEDEKFDMIHCNTPIGGVVGRLAGRKCHIYKIIYQAHGFHFYKGSPIWNWLIYYPVERFLARYTDCLITINNEDYQLSHRFNLRNDNRKFVHGVGIDLDVYTNLSKVTKRIEMGVNKDDIVLISAGDLIDRKNYSVSIEALSLLNDSRVHYWICGEGPELNRLKQLATEKNVEKQVHFLGFRNDIKDLLGAADVFLFSSLQEGLPRSLMEAMALGLPCVVSEIRGNTDLIENGEGGFRCCANNSIEFADKIKRIISDVSLKEKMSEVNIRRIKEYDVSTVVNEMKEIYWEMID